MNFEFASAEVDERERRLLAVATEVAARTADGEIRLAGRVEALGQLVHGLELMHTELSDGTQTLRAAWAHKESSMQAARVQVIQVQAAQIGRIKGYQPPPIARRAVKQHPAVPMKFQLILAHIQWVAAGRFGS